MGTYPELPSYVLATGEDLQDVINKHSNELFGETVLKKFGHKDLPFLPKVLSIAKALPLQLHPVHTVFCQYFQRLRLTEMFRTKSSPQNCTPKTQATSPIRTTSQKSHLHSAPSRLSAVSSLSQISTDYSTSSRSVNSVQW